MFLIMPGSEGTPAYASEIDSFTKRDDFLPDLTDLLNSEVMWRLEKAVRQSNRQSLTTYLQHTYPFRGQEGIDYCNTDYLYARVRRQFARTLIGQLESHVNRLPVSHRRKVKFNESIYKDFKFKESPTLVSTKNMGAIVRMGDYLVGSDKFGHFFSEGWSYFLLAYSEEIDVEKALLFGELTESGYYGAKTTGVFSYADLAANFNGMRFWNELLGRQRAPLDSKKNPRPYVCCEDKRWKIVRRFDWHEYIDAAWDEGFNFNLFRDDALLGKVLMRLEILDAKTGENCDCREKQKSVVDQLARKYGEYQYRILNLDGHDILAPHLQSQSLLDQYYYKLKGNPRPVWKKRISTHVEEKIKSWRNAK